MEINRVNGGEVYMANIINDDGIKELLKVSAYCLGYMASGRHGTTIEICDQLEEILSECKRVMDEKEDE